MARADGFAALMVRIETKDKFLKTKQHIEKQTGMTDMGMAMTSSQVLEWMCKKIMSDIIKEE